MTGRPQASIRTAGLSSIARRSNTLTTRSDVTSGPYNTAGRTVEHCMGVDDLAFLVATLAAAPAWRKAIKAAATLIDMLEDNPGNTPAQRMARQLDSVQTHERMTTVIRNTVYDNYLCQYPSHEHDHEGTCGG